jgi:hypothetical protein
MNPDDLDRCPRCGGAFHCGVDDTTCACFGLQLRQETVDALREHYGRCVCVGCLAAVNRGEAVCLPGSVRGD